MENLAKEQDGYLGIESARNELGITISYWESLESISKWKNNIEHTLAREKGRALWYKKYQLRICKVERDYGFEK
jgi:heme-degrading monooxygenase HmoA